MTDTRGDGFLTFRAVVEEVMQPPLAVVRQDMDERVSALTEEIRQQGKNLNDTLEQTNSRLDDVLLGQSHTAEDLADARSAVTELVQSGTDTARVAHAAAEARNNEFDDKFDDLTFRLNSTLVGLASDLHQLSAAAPTTIERLTNADTRIADLQKSVTKLQQTLQAVEQATETLLARSKPDPGPFAAGSTARLTLIVGLAFASGVVGALLTWLALNSG